MIQKITEIYVLLPLLVFTIPLIILLVLKPLLSLTNTQYREDRYGSEKRTHISRKGSQCFFLLSLRVFAIHDEVLKSKLSAKVSRSGQQRVVFHLCNPCCHWPIRNIANIGMKAGKSDFFRQLYQR